MLVGIMFIFLGAILILVTAKGMSLDNKTTYIIGGLFLTVGILLIIFDFIDYSNGMLVCIGGSVGSLFIWAGTRSIYKTFRCTMKIEATYMGSSSYTNTKGVTTYTLMEINLLVMGLLFIWVVIRNIKF